MHDYSWYGPKLLFIWFISMYVTESSAYWATDDSYVKVNCDAIMFSADIGWITQDMIAILFRLKNLNILCVK